MSFRIREKTGVLFAVFERKFFKDNYSFYGEDSRVAYRHALNDEVERGYSFDFN